MKSRGARYLILACLTVQLIAAVALGRPLGPSPRTHRTEGVVSSTIERTDPTRKGLPDTRILFSDRVSRNNDLLSGQVSRGILLTGRNLKARTLNLGLPSLNPFVSKERFISNWRVFVVGHLIKNAFHRDAPLRTSLGEIDVRVQP